MISLSEAVGDSDPRVFLASKKAKRPCDACRRRKVRCDGDETPGNRCSSCIARHFECTYLEPRKKRTTAEDYVRNLEGRLEKMEKLLLKIRPDAKLDAITEMDEFVPTGISNFQSTPPSVRDYSPDGDDELQSSDDEFMTLNLAEPHNRLPTSRGADTFFGKSSGASFINAAVEMKKELHNHNGSAADLITEGARSEGFFPRRRIKFWQPEQWANLGLDAPEPHYTFPDPDLLPSLVSNYFAHMNLIFPLLHRPTFEQSLADNLHLREQRFGGVVLLVAAVGARFSNDPRVSTPGTHFINSAGCVWFNQVQIALRSFCNLPGLYDLQIYCLSAIFLLGSAAPHYGWTVIGIGVRLAQSVGAHRRRAYVKTPTAGDELWKRAFWILVVLDRLCSYGLGRSSAVLDEDFDLELPIECDDEYWTATKANKAFTQPAEKPSIMSSFVSYLKLNRILASALRKIYPTKKTRFSSPARGREREQNIVTELDSALNKWYDSVPDHLRWDPHRKEPEFLQQSAVLYASYYDLQILVHRPFVSSPQRESNLASPSLAICMNAARSCSRLAMLSKESLRPISHHLTMPVFTAGVVLLFDIWGGKWAGTSIDPTEGMEDVHRCMSVLRMGEKSWNPAGRLWDVLYELTSTGDLPLPAQSPGHLGDSSSVGSTTACTSPISQEHPIPPTSDSQKAIDLQDFDKSSYHTAMGQTTSGFGPVGYEFRTQPAALIRGQDIMGQDTHVAHDRGAPMDSGTISSSLFPNYPPGYGDMTFNFGYASTVSSGIGQQAFGVALDNGSSDTTVDSREGSGPEPQVQQQSIDFSASHDGGEYSVIPNPDGLTMWTNVPHGFEWEGWGVYTHNFSNMTRQH